MAQKAINILLYINTIKRLCLFVCWFVCMSRSLLSCIKSVWKAGGIVRTVSARAFHIPSFKKFHARVHAISRNFHAIFMQFWLFQPFLGQFQHAGYQNACTRAEKFIGNTFKKFHARVHAISRNSTQFSHNLGYFSHFWANFNMLGIKKHILELRNSLVVLGEARGLKKGPKAPKKRPKASKLGRRPPKALRRS